MAEIFNAGEVVYKTNDPEKRKYTIGKIEPLLVQIIPVEPIMQKKSLYYDHENGTPYMNDKGQLAPKIIVCEDKTEIFINPAKLSRFTEEKKG
jgi:hypothetical protein